MSDRSFRQTNLELTERYSGTTADVITAVGSGNIVETVYEDLLVRLIIDVPSSVQADDFFRNHKETLKDRFQQADFWITSHEIQIL